MKEHMSSVNNAFIKEINFSFGQLYHYEMVRRKFIDYLFRFLFGSN
jgi:hypothetical protein